ncbi:SPOR domain-containing protein [Alcaligenes endophyticus]|uniref:SPOR domain-containing protein n=1 Tax=Alcaligenes endophyticus TaxID=1929088 RepID=A0ABT8EJ85_9BURK|nr:SPOR domain-containing protein [Alcaligenes endophyticus]MCX5591687.1 SPOR domain-containing protein [Alcaligenes endophyticus]MDN4121364.1 SPOR domain-containing protein [Alcaligenes endophyticus]
MGFFSRNDSSSTARRAGAGSSDAQIAEMRSRARRRLIGAVVLVLAVIVVVPLLIDNGVESDPEPTLALGNAPLVVPGSISQPPQAPSLQVEEVVVQPPVLIQPDLDAQGVTTTIDQPPVTPPSTEETVVQVPLEAPKPQPKPAVEKKPEPKPKPAPTKPDNNRTDDGSVALAMLEGRIPAGSAASKPAAAPQRGNFILQAAAYSSEKDAQGRRQQLISSGVTNAYVESASAGGRSTFRLRVGPFSSREAAVAAQTRLRSLGYQDSFISAQ